MSVVILGGNECMERQYKDLCRDYKCRVKVFIKPVGNFKEQDGPAGPDDLLHQYDVPQNAAQCAAGDKGSADGHRPVPFQLDGGAAQYPRYPRSQLIQNDMPGVDQPGQRPGGVGRAGRGQLFRGQLCSR